MYVDVFRHIIYWNISACMYVYVCIYIYIYIHTLCQSTHIYIYIYIRISGRSKTTSFTYVSGSEWVDLQYILFHLQVSSLIWLTETWILQSWIQLRGPEIPIFQGASAKDSGNQGPEQLCSQVGNASLHSIPAWALSKLGTDFLNFSPWKSKIWVNSFAFSWMRQLA